MSSPHDRTLIALVLAVLFVMVVSVVFSISFITKLFAQEPPITGNTQRAANITVTVVGTLSITTEDSSFIDFGGCKPGSVIFSDVQNGSLNNSCPGYVPGSIIIRNDGSWPANVTFNTSAWGEAHGGTFLSSPTTSSWIAYKTSNATTSMNHSAGCFGSFQEDWSNITAGDRMRACDYLAYGPHNSFSFDIAIAIPHNVSGGDTGLTIDFYAKIPD